jgi:four helix bundle protein
VVDESSGSYENLLVFQKAHALVLAVYLISKDFPKEELFGLTSQIRRAAVSIPANIAEGYGRYSIAEKIRFYNISQASLNEVKYYLILANDLYFTKTDKLLTQAEEVSKMLDSYIKKLQAKK